MRVLTIGGVTQDIFLTYQKAEVVHLDRDQVMRCYLLLEEGRKIEIDNIDYHVGGGAANVAVSFKKLGHESNVVASVGNDHQADFIMRYLQEREIDTRFVVQKDNLQTSTSFIIPCPSGDRTVLVYRGAACSLSLKDLPITQFRSFDQLYITSLCGQAEQLLPDITRKAQEHNIAVTVNPGSSQLTKNIHTLLNALPSIDTLIVNAHEARMLIGGLAELVGEKEEVPSRDQKNMQLPELLRLPLIYKNVRLSLEGFFKTILAQGPSVVVVTNGAEGIYIAIQDNILYHPSLSIPVVSTVGAGDAFGSTLTALRGSGFSLEDALRGAMLNSASVIGQVGTHSGLLSQEELQLKLLQQSSDQVQKFSL